MFRKGTPNITQFKSGIYEIKDWTRQILDHLIAGTPKYETIIKALAKRQAPVTKADLTTSLLDGYNAWEVASGALYVHSQMVIHDDLR